MANAADIPVLILARALLALNATLFVDPSNESGHPAKSKTLQHKLSTFCTRNEFVSVEYQERCKIKEKKPHSWDNAARGRHPERTPGHVPALCVVCVAKCTLPYYAF
eukprot:766500-Rhodomonas_salina.2